MNRVRTDPTPGSGEKSNYRELVAFYPTGPGAQESREPSPVGGRGDRAVTGPCLLLGERGGQTGPGAGPGGIATGPGTAMGLGTVPGTGGAAATHGCTGFRAYRDIILSAAAPPPPSRRSSRGAERGPGAMEALRRPALPEDAVRYRLFAAAAAGPGGEALLRRSAEVALVRFAPLLASYVWQRQPFRLRYVPRCGEPGQGRGARREERPEGTCEGHPAAGNREM